MNENASKPDEGPHMIWAPLLKSVLLHSKCYHMSALDSPQSLDMVFKDFSFYVQISQ